MSLRYGEVMNNMWQSPEGKTDRKLSIEAALKELEEETGLVAEPEDLKFLINNLNYNCDVYTLKILNLILWNLTRTENGKSFPLRLTKGWLEKVTSHLPISHI